MAGKTLTRSFAGGEISPQLFSRVDLDKFQTGLALCLNGWVLPQGPAQNRPGYGYVLQAGKSDQPVILMPFSYSTQQTFALEFGHQYIRFHTQGATLLEVDKPIANIVNSNPVEIILAGPHAYANGRWIQLHGSFGMPELSGRWARITSTSGTSFTLEDLRGNPINATGMGAYTGGGSVAAVYEVATPYQAGHLAGLSVVQSADVMTITSLLYPPMELRRLGATNWELKQIDFTPLLAAPQSSGAAPVLTNHTYRVVGVAPTNGGYTAPSAPATVANDFSIPGRFNRISWTSVPGGILYFVYKLVGATWGLIGISGSGTYFDDDASKTPDTSAPQYLGLGTAPTIGVSAITPSSNSVSVVPTGAGSTPYTYVVTSLSEDEKEESIASGAATANNNLSAAGNYNTVTWPAVPGVTLYNIYRSVNGIFGFVGRADNSCRFVDENILPNTAITPPVQVNPFQGDGNYPQAATYHEQRRVFGGTLNQPQSIWMTRSGTEKNLGYSRPNRDDDSINVRVVSREAHTIRHMVPMLDLMLLTSGGEWKVASSDTGALTPVTTSIKPQGYSGSSTVAPVVTNRTILFPQDRGGHIRELEFSWEQQGYKTTDVSILAPHLFDAYQVMKLAFSRSPVPCLWSVRSDGMLLGMTYVPEHEVRGWHRHETDGVFESACSVAEGDEDVLYVVVRRTIQGADYRYIERLHTRRFDSAADQFFVDSGLTYSGAPVSQVGGLYHLEGKEVAILADGGVSPPQTVVNGKVSIEAPASKIHVGLPYRCRLMTLPLSMQAQALGQGTQKNINKVHLRVLSSNGFQAGPSFDKLRPYRTRFTEPFGSPPDLTSDEVEITLDPSWNRNGQLCIEQSQPLALMVLGLVLEVATGG